MAIWCHNGRIAIWPLWRQMWETWVFSETAIQMWQSCEDGKSIWPSCLKWEQKWSGGIFSFVFFINSFVNAKSGGHNSFFIESTWFFFWWFLTHSGYYLKLGREFLNTFTNYETPYYDSTFLQTDLAFLSLCTNTDVLNSIPENLLQMLLLSQTKPGSAL